MRDGQGHPARLATNYDTLVISVLAEAQLPAASPHRVAGPCALRGLRTAEVVDARAGGARLAAGVSLVLAAGKLRDHVADGDASFAGRQAGRRLAERWEAGGTRLAAGVGFDAGVLVATVDRQLALERRFTGDHSLDGDTAGHSGRRPVLGGGTGGRPDQPSVLDGRGGRPSILDLTAPTEEAVAATFAHTAVLARRPGNAPALAEAGRFFGRIAHLLDAVEDQQDDDARGAFNPLTATGTSLPEARRLCDDAAHGLALALRELEFEDRHLADTLLGGEVRRAVNRTFAAAHSPTASYARPGVFRKSAAGIWTFMTCGMYRPRWSKRSGRPCDDRCYLRRCDCDPNCGNCGECCNCCDCSCN
ncbi:hypothetical protein HII36_54955 [Nonomuraea sp. NN258]|nr:hypothetical protein [Nonomuraea antri]